MIIFSQLKFSSLFVKSANVFILRLIGMGFSYFAILFISNYYGAETFGRYTISITLLQFLILIASLGLNISTVKLTATESYFNGGKPLNKYLEKTVIVLLITSLLFSITLFFLKGSLATNIFHDAALIDYFKYISFFLIFAIFHVFFSEFLRAQNKFFAYGLFIYVLPYGLFLVLLLVLNQYSFKGDITVLSYLLATTIISLVILFFFPFKKLISPNNFSYKALFSVSFPMMFSTAFMFISEWTDVFMLGAMVSKAEVGIYNASFKLATIALIVINAVNTVLAPKIAELYGKNDIVQIKKVILNGTKLVTFLTLPIVIILIIFSKQLLGLFGSEFIIGSNVLIVVSIGLLFNALSGSVGQILNMTNHQKELRNFTIITVIINIILNYILIPSTGILGAAVASLVANIILNSICVFYIKEKLGFYTFFKL